MSPANTDLTDTLRSLQPHRCVLFFGAGASVPSGAPTATAMAHHLCKKLAGEQLSDDLTEAATILQMRYGRAPVVHEVRNVLRNLQPTGGLLAVPRFGWHSIYTTNYDLLIEEAYRRASVPLVVIRSNYEYDQLEQKDGTPLLKIHGCITQDEVDGSRISMVLTEDDYEAATKYRELLFQRLSLAMSANDIIIIGHSLSDYRLRTEIQRVIRMHAEVGAPGRVILLTYTHDPDRAQLYEHRGFTVLTSGIDEFFDAIGDSAIEHPPSEPKTQQFMLPLPLVSATIDCSHAATLPSNALRLFNGSPATYADVSAGITFERTIEQPIIRRFTEREIRFASIIGVGGVGKTTLARRLAHHLTSLGYLAFEHRNDFPFRPQHWLDVDRRLAREQRRAVLVIDDCAGLLNGVNRLVTDLSQRDNSILSLILTSPRNQWLPRNKAPQLFAHGHVWELSELRDGDLHHMVNLTEREPSIRNLVDRTFLHLSRHDKIAMLRTRCRADMYVCLKNVFASEELDTILLREYAELASPQQDLYRHVAALEAGGTRVHRQLVIRLLGIPADEVKALLTVMRGIVDEYDVEPSEGLYGWSTRHPVIAERIAHYKFADEDELYRLLSTIVDNLNPSVWLELRTLRDLCNFDWGIRRLTSVERQNELYRKLIALAPGERVPWHRLIGNYLAARELDTAAQAIRMAEESVQADPPIMRYKARLALFRAELLDGVLDEDRRAMYLDARAIAIETMQRFKTDKYAYITYGEIATSFAERYGKLKMLDDAIERMRTASTTLLDPDLSRGVDDLIRRRDRFHKSR